MREPGLQGDGKNEATVTSTLTLMPLVIANEQRAPVAVLSPTKRTAVIECFNKTVFINAGATGGERQKVSTSQVSLLQTSHAMAYFL